jgi:hypothetical protein
MTDENKVKRIKGYTMLDALEGKVLGLKREAEELKNEADRVEKKADQMANAFYKIRRILQNNNNDDGPGEVDKMLRHFGPDFQNEQLKKDIVKLIQEMVKEVSKE